MFLTIVIIMQVKIWFQNRRYKTKRRLQQPHHDGPVTSHSTDNDVSDDVVALPVRRPPYCAANKFGVQPYCCPRPTVWSPLPIMRLHWSRWPPSVSTALYWIITDRVSREGKAIGRVCQSVCSTLCFEGIDLGSPENGGQGHRSRSGVTVRAEYWLAAVIIRSYCHVVSCVLAAAARVQRAWAW